MLIAEPAEPDPEIVLRFARPCPYQKQRETERMVDDRMVIAELSLLVVVILLLFLSPSFQIKT